MMFARIDPAPSPDPGPMQLSSTAQHAVRAVTFLAALGDERPARVDEIARALDCPRNYLSKTLHALTRTGILRSARGPTGGFRLAEPPERLSLARIIAPFEPAHQRRCVVGRPECGGPNPCAAHHRWTGVATAIDSFFEQTTIADLLADERRARPKRGKAPARRARR